MRRLRACAAGRPSRLGDWLRRGAFPRELPALCRVLGGGTRGGGRTGGCGIDAGTRGDSGRGCAVVARRVLRSRRLQRRHRTHRRHAADDGDDSGQDDGRGETRRVASERAERVGASGTFLPPGLALSGVRRPDNTHVRFFTFRSARRILVENGFEIEVFRGRALGDIWWAKALLVLVSPILCCLGWDICRTQMLFRVRKGRRVDVCKNVAKMVE